MTISSLYVATAGTTALGFGAHQPGALNFGNDVGWINQMHTEHHGHPLERTPGSSACATNGVGRLLQGLQISDDVVDIPAFGEPSIRHAVTLHLGLRVLDVLAQIISSQTRFARFIGFE